VGPFKTVAQLRVGRKPQSLTTVVEATTSAGTIKCGRKRKSTALDVEVNSVDGKANQAMPKRKVARVSNDQVAEAAGVPWVAPFAKMY
jgi:hypothetical protein